MMKTPKRMYVVVSNNAISAFMKTKGILGKSVRPSPSLSHRITHYIERYNKKRLHAAKEISPCEGNPVFIKTIDDLIIDGKYFTGANAKPTDPTVVICNDSFATYEEKYDVILRYMQRGINVLSFNYRNNGKSQWSIAAPLGCVLDAKAACDFLFKEMNIPPSQILLHGISNGAEVAAQVAAEYPGLNIIIDSSFPKPCHGKNILHGKEEKHHWRKISYYQITRIFIKQIYSIDLEKIISKISGKVCIIHTNAQKTALRKERNRTQRLFKAMNKNHPRGNKTLVTSLLNTLLSIPHYTNNIDVHALAQQCELTKPLITHHEQQCIAIQDRFGKNIFDNMISSIELDLFLYSIGFIDKKS